MDIVELGIGVDTRQVKKGETDLKSFTKTADKAGTSVTNFGKNMRLTKGPTSALSTTSGQLAVQFQDVAVQAQMGTDAVRIFGQQAPQILSVFGPSGAVLGAVAAIGAAVGSSLVSAFGLGGDAVEEFAESVKVVKKSVDDLSDGTYGLSESLLDLAQKSEAAASLQVAIALDAAEIAAKRAREQFQGLGIDGEGMYRSIENVSDGVQRLLLNFDNIARGGLGPQMTLKQLRDGAEAAGLEFQDVERVFQSFLAAIDPNADGAALVGFGEALAELAIKSDDPAFREFANNLLETAMQAETTEERARLLSQAISDFGMATRGANQESIDFVKRLEEQADAIGKTREQILALQAAQIQDPALRARAEEAIKLIEFENQAREEARENERKADEERRERDKARLKAERELAAERRRIRSEDRELIQIEREQRRAEEKEEQDREKRIQAEQEARVKYAMELVRQRAEEEQRIESTRTAALLDFEDKLLKGKSEKQKAAYRLAVNLADAEKRENARQIVSDSYSAAMKAYKALAGIPVIGPALGAAAAGVILAAGVTYAGKSLAGRALGGQVREGESYVVGERGPEVLTMGTGGRIIPNDKLGGQQQVVNRTANITFQISTVDASGFDQLLQSRRGQIIGMINTAMNDQGRKALV